MLPEWGKNNSHLLTCLDKCFLIRPMAALGNHMPTRWLGKGWAAAVNGSGQWKRLTEMEVEKRLSALTETPADAEKGSEEAGKEKKSDSAAGRINQRPKMFLASDPVISLQDCLPRKQS